MYRYEELGNDDLSDDGDASSRIGAALVVEPSLTLIIGKFGYLG